MRTTTGGAAPELSRGASTSPQRGARIWQGAGTVLAIAAFVLLARDLNAIQSMILGLGSGSLIAALALGIVVTYRGSGVINIATGAIAMYSTYVFNSLTSHGDLLVIGWRVNLSATPLEYFPALLVTVLIAAIWGALLYALIFSRLRGASPIAQLVASVGLLLVIQSIVVLGFSATPQPVSASLSTATLRLPGDLVLPANQLILLVAVVAAALLLWAIFAFTRFGLATRAAAEDERNLVLLGYSPTMVSGGNWVFCGVIVALFAVLVTPVNGSVDPTTMTLLVVPALAAALVGRFTSFGIAVAAALAIGILQALIQYLGTKDWFPAAAGAPIPGVVETVPLAIILVALLVQRRGLPSRGSMGTVRLPFSPTPRHVGTKLVICTTIGLSGAVFLGPTWRLAQVNTLVGIAICLSLVILIGFVGQVSLAQMTLAGLAGFVMAKISAELGIGFPLAPILGAVAAALLGVLMALPALRLRGVQLAVLTMAIAVSLQRLVFANPAWSGARSGVPVESPSIFGWNFGPVATAGFGDGELPNPWFVVFCVLMVAVLAGLTSQLRLSRWGRRMLAVRSNERAVMAAGISVAQTKVVAFGLSALVAGFAGAMSGYRFGSVTPEYFGVFASLTFLAFAYMGGISSVTGAVISGFLVTNGFLVAVLRDSFGLSATYAVLVGGLGLILTIVTNPDGIAGQSRIMAENWRSRRSAEPGVADAPSEAPTVRDQRTKASM